MSPANTPMVVAGILTLFQAASQILLTTLALLQYFCIIDFLRELPTFLFIRILYFHNPSCGARITIGQVIDGMVDQAFVLITEEPFTTTRTFYINCINLGLGGLWLLTCFGIMRGGAKNKQTKPVRWPWLITTVTVCAVDLAATVTYATDLFHTRTLQDLIQYVGGTGSAIGNVSVVTWWAPWIMVMIYSRFAILFLINVTLIIIVVIHVSGKRLLENTGIQVEAPVVTNDATTSADDLDEGSEPSVAPPKTVIPRPGLSQSFRSMKVRLFGKSEPPRDLSRAVVGIETRRSSSSTSPERTPHAYHIDMDKKRTVNFPENLLSLPQRLENMILEQRRRLDREPVDTSGRGTPTRASQSLPHLATSAEPNRGRRGTAAELQAQLPWAYIPASAHPMRDQLPPDEDLPPVPLPDYTAFPSFRKASVHRAASSLSSLTQKRDDKSQVPRPPLTQSDVLY